MNKFLLRGAAALLAALVLAITAPGNAAYKNNLTAKPWKLDKKYQRSGVAYHTVEKPGTIVISTRKRFLYLVQGDDRAIRYGIGVGRQGLTWSGSEKISRKAEWPDWTPPPEMRERDPAVPKFMKGGPDNPLGDRALYLGATEYRIHGTAQLWTIGRAVSSGCIRLQNDDVVATSIPVSRSVPR